MPTIGDLQQLQALPLEAKVVKSKERIREWVENMYLYIITNSKSGKTRKFSYFKEPTEEGLMEERIIKKNGKEIKKLVKVPGSKLRKNEYVSEVYDHWVYVSNSCGKDSAVLRHLVREMYGDEIPNVFVNTGVELPGNVKFSKGMEGLETIYPDKHFFQIVKEYGYPIISKEVCECVYGARKYVDKLIEESTILTDRQTDRQTDRAKLRILLPEA